MTNNEAANANVSYCADRYDIKTDLSYPNFMLLQSGAPNHNRWKARPILGRNIIFAGDGYPTYGYQ